MDCLPSSSLDHVQNFTGPLIKLLQFHLERNWHDTDIVKDQQYSNVVYTFFHLKTEAFIEEVLPEPVCSIENDHCTAGTGKTLVINSIDAAGYHLLEPHSVKNVAPSCTAAFFIKGKTIHSLFPIPIGIETSQSRQADEAPARAKRLDLPLSG
jgi:hypothetical protein